MILKVSLGAFGVRQCGPGCLKGQEVRYFLVERRAVEGQYHTPNPMPGRFHFIMRKPPQEHSGASLPRVPEKNELLPFARFLAQKVNFSIRTQRAIGAVATHLHQLPTAY